MALVNRPTLHRRLTVARRPSPTAGHALIRHSADLRRLYQRAAAACEPGLRVVLNENLQTLDVLIADLLSDVLTDGTGLVGRGSWRGAARRQAMEWMLRTAVQRDDAWMRVLANRETALLREFEREIARAPADLARVLRRQLPRLYGIHSDMDTLVGTARY